MLRVRAYAKINLWLRVLSQRSDGYHDIETFMAPLDLHDTVSVELIPRGIEVESDAAELPRGEQNLAGRAARAFLEEAGCNGGVRIFIEKRIPWGAGLGGGSSNAAAVLRALNFLTGKNWSMPRLSALAARVGSDCPWSLESVPRVCRGRGELLGPPEPLPPGPRNLLLLKPPFAVPTPWAYQRLAEQRSSKDPSPGAAETSANDLEKPVFEKYLLLPVLKNFLEGQAGVCRAAMTGSGSAMFAILEEGTHANDLASRLQTMFGETLWCQPARLLETVPADP